jgi:hypothetical protein
LVNKDFVFELPFVEVGVLAYLLTPAVVIVKVDVLFWSSLNEITNFIAYSCHRFVTFRSLKPRVVLFVEHPVQLLELYRRQILLVCPLLIVERKEESVKIKLQEVVSAIIHGHCWEEVLFL